ncbi:MAG: HAD hydrolase-like protein [Lachnospiraceae bacterium]|nr:HAD hydrolase-like protein [Lachnospiraceae bacterium]
MKYLLFDLDGTLTRSGDGIMNGVKFALLSIGIEETDTDKLSTFVGPPLEESFAFHYGIPAEEVKPLIVKYKEYYDVKGVYESAPYEGIPETLQALKDKGFFLAIASSKPQELVDLVTDHFKIAHFFDLRVGSTPDRKIVEKPDVIRLVFQKIAAQTGEAEEDVKNNSIMIGDRKYDVNGAHAVGIPCIGVRYGYAPAGELEEAGAEFLAATPEKIIELV